MANNWQVAHLRMLENLPRRTHEARVTTFDLNWRKKGGGVKKKLAVIVKGVRYQSLTAAAKALGVTRPTVNLMIQRGMAAYG
jgi:TPP-dependent indolepyruvate ferredoxin oxidoreductase alpha subunit